MKKTNIVIFASLALALIVIYLSLKGRENTLPLGSVSVTSEYNATSTPFDTGQTDGLIQTGYGTLGSLIITSTGDMVISLLDATTTEAAVRPSARRATSSAELARIDTATVGTYVFDVSFVDGLYLDVVSGANGTTTITYRK